MFTIGIDIGGTNARVALLDENFNIIRKEITKTSDKPFDEVIIEISDLINKVDYENKAKTIGIAAPGPIDKEKGMILDANNMPDWQYKPFIKLIEEKTGRCAFLTNDANAAAMAQAIDDKSEMIVFITVSTGVGGGIVYQGKLIEGKRVYAGEFGTMIVSDEDRKHKALYQGTIESLCSGTAIAKKASELYGFEMNAKEVFERFAFKEYIAVNLINEWVEYFSRAIANILQTIEPEVFYLGGSVILHNPWLLELLKEKTKDKVYIGLKEHINLSIAKYGEDAGIIGAAYNSYVKSGGVKC